MEGAKKSEQIVWAGWSLLLYEGVWWEGISRTGRESNEVGELNQSGTRHFCESLRCFRVAHGKTHKLFIVIFVTLGMEYLEMGEQLRNTLSLDAAGLLQALMLLYPLCPPLAVSGWASRAGLRRDREEGIRMFPFLTQCPQTLHFESWENI